MCAEKVNAPTVDEVRELLSRATPGENATIHWRAFSGDECEIIAALCNHSLASQQPMTAGEFAGLALGVLRNKRLAAEQLARMLGHETETHGIVAQEIGDLEIKINALMAEHNITIVGPTNDRS